MKFTIQDSPVRIVGKQMKVTDLFADSQATFDFVIVELDGFHRSVINHVSEQAYFVLSGTGIIRVGSIAYDVKKEDFIFVPKAVPHSLKGKMRYAVLSSPPFSLHNETLDHSSDQ
jgi:mannose-6-phosphate isomerase-like protein (cupin superfamily)